MKLKKSIDKKIEKQTLQKQKYIDYHNVIDIAGIAQISTSDSDSRQIAIRNNVLEVVYAVQITADALHNIPIDF